MSTPISHHRHLIYHATTRATSLASRSANTASPALRPQSPACVFQPALSVHPFRFLGLHAPHDNASCHDERLLKRQQSTYERPIVVVLPVTAASPSMYSTLAEGRHLTLSYSAHAHTATLQSVSLPADEDTLASSESCYRSVHLVCHTLHFAHSLSRLGTSLDLG